MTTIDAVAQPASGTRSGAARRVLLIAIGVGLVVAVVLLAIGTAADNGHAQLHAFTALVLLLLAGALAWRSGSAGMAAAPLGIGLAVLSVPILIEGIGALGYDDVTGERTGALANLHDIGLATTGFGMLALIVGLAASLGMFLAHRTALSGRVAAVIALATGIVGLLGIKVLVMGM